MYSRVIYPALAGVYPISQIRACQDAALPRACGGVYLLAVCCTDFSGDLPRACGDIPPTEYKRQHGLRFTPRLRGCTSIAKGEDPINSRSPQHGAVPTRHLLNLPMQLSRVGADNGKTRSIRKTAMQIYYRPIPKCIFEFERIRFSTLVFFKPTLVSFRARCRSPAKPRKPVSSYANITRSQDK